MHYKRLTSRHELLAANLVVVGGGADQHDLWLRGSSYVPFYASLCVRKPSDAQVLITYKDHHYS